MVLRSRSLCLAVSIAVLPAAAAAQEEWRSYSVSAGFDYSAGRYGDTERTEIVYLPFNAKAELGAWTVSATAPWLSVAGPALILDGAGGGTVGTRADAKTSGIGDITLDLTYSVQSLWDRGTFVDLTLRGKLPTASFAKGLGTGEADGAVQIDVAQVVGQFTPFATVGYKWVGVPDGFSLRNTIYGSAGIQYAWSDRVTTGVAYDYRQSSLRGAPAPQEGLLYLNLRMTDAWSVNLYGVAGFSANSPGAGAGAYFTYRWQ